MHVRHSLPALFLALAAPALAQSGSVRDFRLPPDPEATPTPEVQGPVDPEAPFPTTPRVIPTAPPTAAPSPTPRPTAAPDPDAPREAAPSPAPAPPQGPQQETPRPAPRAAPAPAGPANPSSTSAEAPAATPAAAEFPAQPDEPPGDAAATPAPPASAPASPPAQDGAWATWLAAVVAVLVLSLALTAGLLAWRRRRQAEAPAPAIEPPVARVPDPAPPARIPDPSRPGAAPAQPAPPARAAPAAPAARANAPAAPTLAVQPLRFSRSVMNASFACRVTLQLDGGEAWHDVAVEADLVTAHGAAPIGEQLAEPATPLAPFGTLATLAPGEPAAIEGEVRLPLQQVRVIRQGSAAVYVPLLRLRVAAPNKAPLARTYLVGQLPDRPGGRLRPFRLDEMPQVYQAIGIRPLDGRS